MAARFVEKIGLEYGLRAVRSLHEQGIPLNCRVIGSGPLESELRSIVDSAGVRDVVRFLGRLNHEDHLREMANADIFLQPSVTARNGDSEGGAPTTILEAQACGVAVVATTHADIPNIVEPEQSAVLVAERDSNALSSALLRILSDPERRIGMGKSGQDFVRSRHDSHLVAAQLENYYFDLMKTRANRPQ